MRLSTNHQALALVLELDPEDAQVVDLTAAGIGADVLEFAARSCRQAALSGCDPSTGEAWAPLSPATVKQKGNALVGIKSGTMLSQGWDAPPEVTPTSATWRYTGPAYAGLFHQQRRLIGWTPEAIRYALERLSK